ncbi:hypothetical protein LTR64_007658 [Lithohypha guttulata]|uniref:uncharacterized protein n=1 Tax=Lithohypha guttulata TaxID=1690604 RepID=UPI002DE1EEBA|nr:hypothetical protein LTR51_007167 [Lithohypha guttulata]
MAASTFISTATRRLLRPQINAIPHTTLPIIRMRAFHGHDFFLKIQPLRDNLLMAAPLIVACGTVLLVDGIFPSYARPIPAETSEAGIGEIRSTAAQEETRKEDSASKERKPTQSDRTTNKQEVVNKGPLYERTARGAETATIPTALATCKGCDVCYGEGYAKGYDYGFQAAVDRGYSFYGYEFEKKKVWSKDFAKGFAAGCQKGYKDAWFAATTSS